jgi:histidine ammonia-lyase
MQNVEKVLGIELLTAAQALDFRRPAKTSPILEELMSEFRKVVGFNDADRILHTDMINSINFIANYKTNNSTNK